MHHKYGKPKDECYDYEDDRDNENDDDNDNEKENEELVYLDRLNRNRSVLWGVLMIIISTLCSCSPGYVIRASWEETKILWNGRKISEVLQDPRTTADEQRKLKLVLATRDFASDMGLKPGNTFTRYSRINRDTLAWVLVASKPDAFELHTWWFPIVGHVPYKGFFERADADQEGKILAERGYEIWIRDTTAFSTLGWFNDPVLSTTLKEPETSIVNTIIHESTHRTVWIKNSVEFNESLANFVGLQGAVNYYEELVKRAAGTLDEPLAKAGLEAAKRQLAGTFAMAEIIMPLIAELKTLYSTELPREIKIQKRQEIFDRNVLPLHQKYPTMKALRKPNNAEIMQLAIYMSELGNFKKLYDKSGDWEVFLGAIQSIAEKTRKSKELSPFDELKRVAAG